MIFQGSKERILRKTWKFGNANTDFCNNKALIEATKTFKSN